MDSFFPENANLGRSRNRCYSSMNYQEYQDFFGTPPKMPAAPSSKPLEDPQDIPDLQLQQQAKEVRQPLKIKQIRKVQYKIQTIPEIQGSEDLNSNAICTPKKNFEIQMVKMSSKLQFDGQQMESIALGPRKRNRPRSYSENSPLNSKLKIIDFLKQTSNRGRKMVKIQ